jgi:glycosyltransferase involved in cell wall biosynthesis
MNNASAAVASEPPNRAAGTPRVSVIMLTYNRPQFIGRAIQSVVAQDFQDWELIVVQDGDQELTKTVVREWQAKDQRLRYFHRDKPGNVASALNFGVQQARGDFIAILDDDDQWISTGKLSRQVAFLEKNPEYVACGGGAIVIDDKENEQLRYLKPENDDEIRSKILQANPMAHSTTVYRKSVAEKLGLYDDGLPGYQDWDLFLKMAHVGKLHNFQEPLMYYTLWSGGTTYSRLRLNAQSAVRIVARHRRDFPGAVMARLLSWAYLVYTYLPPSFRSASFSFLSRLKKRFFSSGAKQRA